MLEEGGTSSPGGGERPALGGASIGSAKDDVLLFSKNVLLFCFVTQDSVSNQYYGQSHYLKNGTLVSHALLQAPWGNGYNISQTISIPY